MMRDLVMMRDRKSFMTLDTLQGKILVASAAAYCIANIGWWLQPSLIHEVMIRFQVGESAGGLIASAEMTAVAVGAALFGKLLDRFSLLLIASIGVAVSLTGAAASIVVQDYDLLLLSRSITGFGEGAMLTVASASLASFKDPDRAYGHY